MSRKCSTCQHLKRAEIDRRLAAGEPCNVIAKAYGINPSSLHRHRANCIKLASSNDIMKEAARGTAALACLPSPDELGNAYAQLMGKIDVIVNQAQTEGSLKVALSGLNSVRQTLDSMSRLAARQQAKPAHQPVQELDLERIFKRAIERFDREPELKARIAEALLEADTELQQAPLAARHDKTQHTHRELKIDPTGAYPEGGQS